MNKSCSRQSFSTHYHHPLPNQGLHPQPLDKLYLSTASKSKQSSMDKTSMTVSKKMTNNDNQNHHKMDITRHTNNSLTPNTRPPATQQIVDVTTSRLGINNDINHNHNANNKINKRPRDNLDDVLSASKKRKLINKNFAFVKWTDILSMGWKEGDEIEFITDGKRAEIGIILKLDSDGYITIITGKDGDFESYSLEHIKFNINRRRSPILASSLSNNLERTS